MLEVINEQEVLGKEFRIYGDADNPLFLAKDVAEWIEYSGRTGQLLNTVDEEEKLMHTLYASGQKRQMWFLTEDGLYEILMQSRKPIAKEFKKEVKRILKSIRKDGGYIVTNEDDDDSTIMAKALMVAQRTIDNQKKRLEEANKKIEIDAPKVTFADTIIKSDKSIGVGDLAKLISNEVVKIGRNRLFEKLREWNFGRNYTTGRAC
ncbi:BRO family protein [Bacillus cereus group sp. BfR-BA-01380]|uniref:BRO family protein n=1 Tax=Bacillus cereus group sp. BfR-BA-01380 TaxID=2920324 RepID=UPI001F57E9E1|nr:BRO family protein [Bacillus cereus group sp. BfR-BA-01380]